MLKVSKNRDDFMKLSFLPKTNEIIVRTSAQLYFWEKRCLCFLLRPLAFWWFDQKNILCLKNSSIASTLCCHEEYPCNNFFSDVSSRLITHFWSPNSPRICNTSILMSGFHGSTLTAASNLLSWHSGLPQSY